MMTCLALSKHTWNVLPSFSPPRPTLHNRACSRSINTKSTLVVRRIEEIRGAETIMHGFLSLPRECIGAHEVLRDESHNASEGGIYPLKHSGSGSLIDFGIGIQVESEDDVINGHLGTKPRKSGR